MDLHSRDALYPGTFDPMTNGHEDLIRRAARIFDRVVVAVASNPQKAPMFTLDQRIELAKTVVGDLPNVEVMGYTGLTVETALRLKTPTIIRGLRAVADFEFEFQLASMGRQLSPHIEHVFLTPKVQFTFISSTLVREIAMLNGNVDEFVHPSVAKALRQKAQERSNG